MNQIKLTKYIVIVGVFIFVVSIIGLSIFLSRVKNEEELILNANQKLIINPGEVYRFWDDILISFRNGGTEFSVPYITFGSDYDNPLPIVGFVEIFKNGQTVSFRNLGCKTNEVMTDVLERHVGSCKIDINLNNKEIEVNNISVKRVIEGDGWSLFRPDYTTIIQGKIVDMNPLLYFGVPKFFVQDNSNGDIFGGAPERSGGPDYDFDFPIITNFGVSKARYRPNELYNGVSKSITIGPATIVVVPIKPIDLKNFCWDSPLSNKGQKLGMYCRLTNKQFSFNISMIFNTQQLPSPKIINFNF